MQLSFIAVHAQGDRVVLYGQNNEEVAFFDGEYLVSSLSGEILATVKGNLVFEGESDRKRDIALMLGAEDIFEEKNAKVYSRNMRSVVYEVWNGQFYYGGSSMPDSILYIGRIEKQERDYIIYNRDDAVVGKIAAPELEPAKLTASFHLYNSMYELDKVVLEKMSAFKAQFADEGEGTIKPYWGRINDEWIWDGEVLKPRWGGRYEDEWIFDGQTLRPLHYVRTQDEWVWDGELLKPQWGGGGANVYAWDGRVLKPYWTSDTEREYRIEDNIVKPMWGNRPEDEWIITGDIPIPVIALVVLGIANR